MVWVNVISRGDEIVVAACDADILGRVFKEGKRKLDVSEDFYKGKEVTVDEVIQLLADATIANLTGKEVVEAAIEAKVILKECVIYIDKVPHAQMCRMLAPIICHVPMYNRHSMS